MPGKIYDNLHRKPYKFHISFLDSEDYHLLDEYDMFRPRNNTFGIIDLSWDNPYGSNGRSYIEIHDPKKNIDFDKVRKDSIVLIQGSKDLSQLPLYNFSYGVIKRIHRVENKLGNMFYAFENTGSGKIIADSVIQYVRKPQYKNLRRGFSNIDIRNNKATIYNHLMTLFTDKNVLPSNFGYTLQERGNFSLEEISEKLTEVYPSITKSYTKATDLINELADYAGCVWGVDEYNQVYFRHINDKTLGHVLKSYHNRDDDPDYTGIIQDDEIREITSTDSNDGYFDVNFAFVSQSNIYDVGGNVVNYLTTYNNDLAVRVKAGTSRFRNLTMTISRVGPASDEGNPQDEFMTGHIAKEQQGKPGMIGRDPVANFWHPVLDVPESPRNVSVNITTEPQDIDINAFYWIILHRKGTSEQNTIRWYHDNDVSKRYTNRWSAIRPVSSRERSQDVFIPSGWQVTNKGPVFSYAFANYSKIPNVAYNPFSFDPENDIDGKKRAPVETVYRVNWINDVYTMQKFLNLSSFTGSQEPMTFQFSRVYNPNVPIRSGFTSQLITRELAPEETGGIMGTITNVSYKMTGRNLEDPAGTSGLLNCAVDFVTYTDSRIPTN